MNAFITLQGNILVHVYEKERNPESQQREQLILHQIQIHAFISCLLPVIHLGIFSLECIYKPLNYFQKQGEKKRI